MTSQFKNKYRSDIDGLRALSVIAIVFFHAFPSLVPGGFVGVDIFFVISGFLITKIILDANTFSYRDFYKRRILRLFPSLIFILFFTIIIGWLCLLKEEYQLLGEHIFYSALFLENIHLLRESNYFDLASHQKPLLHLWSLALEGQFYIIWPLLILIFKKINRNISWIFLILIGSSFLWNVLSIESAPISTFYLLPTRLWELSIGGICATYLSQINHLSLIKKNILSIFGFVLIILSFFILNKEINFPGYYAIVPVIGSAFVISTRDTFLNRFILSTKPLVYIGLISYPLYLWHWPLLSFARITTPEISLDSKISLIVHISCLAISLLLAFFSYQILEKPLKATTKSKPSKQVAAYFLVSSLFFLGILGLIIKNQKGFPHRFAADRLGYPSNISDDMIFLKNCQNFHQPGISWCYTSNKSLNTDIVLIGDSHAMSIADGIASYFAKKNKSVSAFGVPSNIPLIAEETNSIPRGLPWVFNHAIKQNATVILAGWWPYYFSNEKFGIDIGGKSIEVLKSHRSTKSETDFTNRLKNTLDKLTKNNINIIFLFDYPELGFSPEARCFTRPIQIIRAKETLYCGVNKIHFEERSKNYSLAVKQILKNYPSVRVFDPSKHLCDSKYCHVFINNQYLYADDHHLRQSGSMFLSEYYDF